MNEKNKLYSRTSCWLNSNFPEEHSIPETWKDKDHKTAVLHSAYLKDAQMLGSLLSAATVHGCLLNSRTFSYCFRTWSIKGISKVTLMIPSLEGNTESHCRFSLPKGKKTNQTIQQRISWFRLKPRLTDELQRNT